MTVQAALITGAGRGLGLETTRVFAERGWQVFAADLTPPPAAPGIVPIRMDVSDAAAVADGVRAVAELAPRGLGCVVNFAGVLTVGPLVEIPESQLHRLMNINVLGTYRVNAATFELVRTGGGRIVNISSETGWQRALMLNGPYAMSKHAIEAYSDALRRELMFVGVPVIVVQPGPFRTDMVGGIDAAFAASVRPDSPFARLAGRVGRMAAAEHRRAHDPAVLAEVVWTAATARTPKSRYSVRPDLRRRLLDRLPVPVVDRLLQRMLA